jgi:acyl carrier protein
VIKRPKLTDTPAFHPVVNISAVDQVMLGFQESMLQMTNGFVQAQQQVMLAYLKNTGTTFGAIPIGHPQMVSPAVRTKLIPAARQIITTPALELLDDDLPQAQPDESTLVSTSDDSKRIVPIVPAEAMFWDRESLVSTFIDLVSQRTGYPVEMLDPTLDLESDLGIDSIKRVEILGKFRRLLPEGMYEHFEGSLEELAGLRTLQGISDWIRNIPQPGQALSLSELPRESRYGDRLTSVHNNETSVEALPIE